MQFVSVRDLRGKSAEVWRKLKNQREMVVTSNGKPVAILSSVNDETLEESLAAIRKNRAIAAVDAIQRNSLEAGTDSIALDEINKEISVVRKARSK